MVVSVEFGQKRQLRYPVSMNATSNQCLEFLIVGNTIALLRQRQDYIGCNLNDLFEIVLVYYGINLRAVVASQRLPPGQLISSQPNFCKIKLLSSKVHVGSTKSSVFHAPTYHLDQVSIVSHALKLKNWQIWKKPTTYH